MAAATRGQLAYALYEALGLPAPTGSSHFSDAGYLAGVTSTLMDLGITNGVAPGRFGVTDATTRGQAFTMIARALGLADARSSIEQASRALVNAGIVKGYGNDPNNLGLNDPLAPEHLKLLMDRVGPELDRRDPATGVSRREVLVEQTDQERDRVASRQDPALAKFVQSSGAQMAEIDDELRLRDDLFVQDQRRLQESYARAADQAVKGVDTDFENRGLYRSGTRVRAGAEQRAEYAFQAENAAAAAQRQHEQGDRDLGRQRNAIQRAQDQARIDARTRTEERNIEREYR